MDKFEPPETRYAECDGLSIAYQVWGEGDRDIVLIPGMISHLEAEMQDPDYVRWLRGLGAFGRLAIFDKRGNGMSDRIQGSPTLDERVADVTAVMDDAGMASAAVIGLSEGAAMACVYAAMRPERVERLVLCGGYAQGRLARGMLSEEALQEALDQFRSNWGKPGQPHPFSVFGPGPDDPQGQQEFARLERQCCTPNTIATLFDLAARIDIRALLPSIYKPTLVLHREGEVNGGAAAAPLVELVEGAEHRVLAGDQHLPWFGDVDAYIAEIGEFLTGAAPAVAQATRALASILFTDIAASTAHQSRVGDAEWRRLMNRHDDICARQVKRHGGRLVKFTGDGMLATFSAPTAAIACATILRDSLAALDLASRAGVHTGEIELRGEDVSGLGVVVAARIMDQADGGQMLASDLTRQLMLGAPFRFEDRGERELKGVPGLWRLHAVSAA